MRTPDPSQFTDAALAATVPHVDTLNDAAQACVILAASAASSPRDSDRWMSQARELYRFADVAREAGRRIEASGVRP